jgi:hypothetical protein
VILACPLDLAARFVGRIDNRPWFRDIFASHEKWFHHAKNCFTWLSDETEP